MIVTVVTELTDAVLTVKVTEVEPAGTVTEAGTVALVEFEDRLTTVPPVPAAPFNVTVPTVLVPPTRVAGESEIELNVAGVTVRVVVWLVPFKVPVRVA